MEESTIKESQADVRILTLKRWNFPQVSRLFPTDGSGPAAEGDYISYDSHHFICIEKCTQVDEHPFRWAHCSLEKLRKSNREAPKMDVHMVQSLALIGENCTFWDDPGDVLYISFLQLTNTKDVTMAEIRDAIDSIVKAGVPKACFALYHSLDFCDLVLFMKNLSHQECSRILQELAIVRDENLSVLRDSFTIYGLRYGFLKNSFQKLNQGETPQWEDCASLSVQLSIQSYEVWNEFDRRLKEACIPYRPVRTFGRYDVRLISEEISGAQILQLLYLLDSMADESEDRAFGGYEISIEAPWNETILGNPVDAKQERGLEKVMETVMAHLCGMCAKADPDSFNYADETRRSLEALLKNGFSEEFVLSVLPTFLSFLQITIELDNYRHHMPLDQEETFQLRESQGKMTRHYFNALNIVALCTMHSERQFVLAPAFNATYFDVPPKLLTYYSAVAQEVINALKAESDKNYQFLFAPNYEKDINVRPLELQTKEDLSQHLAVVHLHESYFYDPVLTIKLFCHEAAHYLSDRRRKDRAKYIFRAVSFLLLINTPLRFMVEESKDDAILAVMADSLADFMLAKFLEKTPNPVRGISFHLQDISEFLENNDYGILFFTDTFDASRICDGWQKALRESVVREPNVFGVLFEIGLECIQETLRSDYLVDLFRKDREGMYVYEVFTRVIAYYSTFPYGFSGESYFDDICENVLQSFSEAYADLRMSELMGIEFSWRDYEGLFNEVSVDNRYQKIMRHDALLGVMAPKENWERWILSINDNMPLSYAVEQIEQYLKLCHEQPANSECVVQILQEFNNGDVTEQCNHIRKTIQNYREYLTQYCQNIVEMLCMHEAY